MGFETRPERIRRVVHGGVAGMLCLVCIATADPVLRVEIYSSEDSAEQHEVVASLEATLAALDEPVVQLHRLSTDDSDRAGGVRAADLRIAIGTRAAEALSRSNDPTPRLYGFIPHLVWQRAQTCCPPGARDSALFLDRPPLLYLHLARALMPAAQRIGVLLGPTSRWNETALRLAVGQAGLDLVIRWVEAEGRVGPALRSLLDQADVLIALPDPAVFNRETIYPVLLASYSARLPVVAYSAAMVRAGAAASVLLSPGDAGRDLAAEIVRFAATGRLGPARSSPGLSVAINRNVLRSLRIEVGAEDELLDAVREVRP